MRGTQRDDHIDSDYKCHTADDSIMRTFGLPSFDENILLSLKDIDIYRPSKRILL